jgi:3-oxoacyl-[acyl-carrier protein] reductase
MGDTIGGSAQPLQGQVALVTGASRGIGLAVARRLAADGAEIVLSSRSAEAMEKVGTELRGRFPGRRFLASACDVARFDEVERLVGRCVADLGRLDILVNNAGITRDNLILRMSEEEWHTVLATNLTGMFNTCRLVSKQMFRQRSGRIVNVTSVVGLIGNAGQANYAASKGGAIAMTFSLARELASRGITVNAVAPGFIDTDMTAAIPDEVRSTLSQKIPLGRVGSAEEVAAAVAFLCGPGATYITGTVLRVDGGLAMG